MQHQEQTMVDKSRWCKQLQHMMPYLHSPNVHKKSGSHLVLTHKTCWSITCKICPGTSTICRPACLPTFMRGLLGLFAAEMKHASVTVTHCPDLDLFSWLAAGDHTTLPLLFRRQETVAATTGCISSGCCWAAATTYTAAAVYVQDADSLQGASHLCTTASQWTFNS